MQEWLKQIIATTLLSMILSLIIPEKKMGKSIKMMLSILVSVVVINPLTNFNFDNLSDIFNNQNSELIYQNTYLEYVYQQKIDNYEQLAVNTLNSNGIKSANVSISQVANKDMVFMIENIQVDLSVAVIKNYDENIDIIELVKSLMSQTFSVEKEAVQVYGWR